MALIGCLVLFSLCRWRCLVSSAQFVPPPLDGVDYRFVVSATPIDGVDWLVSFVFTQQVALVSGAQFLPPPIDGVDSELFHLVSFLAARWRCLFQLPLDGVDLSL